MRQKTVLDHVHPTVVVRRRIYDATLFRDEAPKAAAAEPVVEEDEDGPPSSVNVARALAALRADELQRVEELIATNDAEDDDGEEEDDEEERAAEAAAHAALVAPAAPTVRSGKEIALGELAARMKVSPDELVTALVTGGFFSVSAKSVLPRETARVGAQMFGWRVVDDDSLDVTKPARAKVRAPSAAPAPKGKGKANGAAKARTARPTKRGK